MTLRQAPLSPREKKALDASLRRSKRGARSEGSIPALVLLPLVGYLPKEYVIQEPYGEGMLAEALRSAYGYVVIETSFGEANLTLGALHTAGAKDFEKLYATQKPFALLAPVTVLGDPDCQHLFQRFGIQIMLLDRLVSGQAYAWFCFALHRLGFITYGHIPLDDYLPSWMAFPASRQAIRRGARSVSRAT